MADTIQDMSPALTSNGPYCLWQLPVITFPVVKRIYSVHAVLFYIEIYDEQTA